MTDRHGERPDTPSNKPAPTITSKARTDRLVVKGTAVQHPTERTVDRPALAFGHNAAGWQWERPATTVSADPRIPAPGYRTRDQRSLTPSIPAEQAAAGEQEGTEAIRLSLTDALILQGFDRSYPLQGSRTKCFEQVGNAIPPPLARAILAELIDP